MAKERSLNSWKHAADTNVENGHIPDSANAVKTFAKKYLVVYAIIMGKHLLYLPTDRVSDAIVDSAAYCLQGPYMWSLYRVQYGLPERLVALLFVTGFVSEGVASPLVGAWADQ